MKFNYQGSEFKLILLTLAGSRFYGTHYDGVGSVDEDGNSREHPFNPDYVSDNDFRGVFIATPDTKLGLTGAIEQIEVKKDKNGVIPIEQQNLIKELNEKLGLNMHLDEDILLYEIKKFIGLALENNPNIMDLLFSDDNSIIYANKKGNKLLNNRDIFISKKTKFTFSGYALSQLHRIKSHNKYLVQFPKTNEILARLKIAYNAGDIDYNFISDHFGGNVSSFVTGITQQEANKFGKVQSIEWAEFIGKYSDSTVDVPVDAALQTFEWEQYRKPQIISYCYPKDLKGTRFDLDKTAPYEANPDLPISTKSTTLKEFLLTEACFRIISKTQYNIFTPADKNFNGGIFSRNGDLKFADPEEVGLFVFQLTIDENNYKKDLDHIGKLWEWRTNRNEKRSVLEENFGYDVKHGSHCIRLLLGGHNILKTGEYHPRLSGDDLRMVKGVLNGKYPYEELIALAETMEKELESLYVVSTLQNTPNHKKANDLLLSLSKW